LNEQILVHLEILPCERE